LEAGNEALVVKRRPATSDRRYQSIAFIISSSFTFLVSLFLSLSECGKNQEFGKGRQMPVAGPIVSLVANGVLVGLPERHCRTQTETSAVVKNSLIFEIQHRISVA
jgi:hypothetical protein